MFSVILWGVEHPGNLGAVARSMKNFGFSDLVLVDPQCSIDEECRRRAVHAQDILDSARVCSVEELDTYDMLVGTTGKLGNDYNMLRTPMDIPALVEKLRETDVDKTRIGIVFGRESCGLTNEELERCHLMTTIPTVEAYPVMNLSHAVTILLYELSVLWRRPLSDVFEPPQKEQLEQALVYIDAVLDKMTFATPEKKETQRQLWRKLVHKSFLTKRELFALLGFLKKLDERL